MEIGEKSSARLVQLRRGRERLVARVDEPHLCLVAAESVVELANVAAASSNRLTAVVEERLTGDRLDYDAVYAGASEWHLLPPIDHPEPARLLISGTGLTHLGSAANRNAMHGRSDAELTDSMRMFRWGIEGGRPEPGRCGTAPEWFYKGNGTVLCAPREALVVPSHSEDGGEEAEIAGIYLIDAEGRPRRIGMAAGNEFSDHKFEKTNYLNLAGSKLRTCSLGPELVVHPDFEHVPGRVAIERREQLIWERQIATGSREMCHSLANIEHHHFKFDLHRRPGDVHVHFYGAHSLSFGEGVHLIDGDVMTIQFTGFGRALRNPIAVTPVTAAPIAVFPL